MLLLTMSISITVFAFKIISTILCDIGNSLVLTNIDDMIQRNPPMAKKDYVETSSCMALSGDLIVASDIKFANESTIYFTTYI